MTDDSTRATQEPKSIPWIAISLSGALLVIALAAVVIVVSGPEKLNADAKLRLDALKLVLTGVAGYGAAVTVWLALRRQQHHEHHSWAQRELDLRKREADDINSQSRRALELYSAASDQLASEQAPVRLAGLYSFERLAIEDSNYRQTVVDVLCAYLRMNRRHDNKTEERSEHLVRSAVQDLLLRHLQASEPDAYWPDARINLNGAALHDFDARAVTFGHASFNGTRFTGRTDFTRADFVQRAEFERSRFDGYTSFRKVRFHDGASFDSCEFAGEEVGFVGAIFDGDGPANFRLAKFSTKRSPFRGVKFRSTTSTNFNRAQFSGTQSNFTRCMFLSPVTSFAKASFATFAEPFMKAKLTGRVLVVDVSEWQATLRGAHILGELEEAHLLQPAPAGMGPGD